MKVTYTTRVGEVVTRTVRLGSHELVGMRIDSVTFENSDELKKMLSLEEYKRWAFCTLLHSFRAVSNPYADN